MLEQLKDKPKMVLVSLEFWILACMKIVIKSEIVVNNNLFTILTKIIVRMIFTIIEQPYIIPGDNS